MNALQTEAVLADTLRVRDEVRRALEELGRLGEAHDALPDADRDAIRVVTGRSSLARALDSAHGMLDRLDRSIQETAQRAGTGPLDADRSRHHGARHDEPHTPGVVTRRVEPARPVAAHPSAR